eukprot:scaffold5605_cov128-Cylindrotheca_fusiformis.AAC.7
MTVTVSGQCSLCPGGASFISNPNAQIHGLSDSCGVVEAVVAESSSNCNNVVASSNAEFDYTGFCCSDSGAATVGCQFCGGDTFDPNLVLGVDINPQRLTCQEAKGITDYAKADTFTCQQLLTINEGCCKPSCTVCPEGSTMTDGNRLLPGQSITCGNFDVQLGNLNSDSQCTAQLAPFADYDLAAYCGCTGSPAPSNCDFCEDGLEDRTAVVPNTNGLQCSAFERLADFIKSPGVCSTWQECCSDPPSSGPITRSSASGLSMSFAALVTVAALLAQR